MNIFKEPIYRIDAFDEVAFDDQDRPDPRPDVRDLLRVIYKLQERVAKLEERLGEK